MACFGIKNRISDIKSRQPSTNRVSLNNHALKIRQSLNVSFHVSAIQMTVAALLTPGIDSHTKTK